MSILKNTSSILSIFSGRLYDIGIDAAEKFKIMSNYVHRNSKCKTLWASCRMAYDIRTAKNLKQILLLYRLACLSNLKNLDIPP